MSSKYELRLTQDKMLKVTKGQERLYKKMYETLLDIFALTSDTIIESDDYTEEEKLILCERICADLIDITNTRRELSLVARDLEQTNREV